MLVGEKTTDNEIIHQDRKITKTLKIFRNILTAKSMNRTRETKSKDAQGQPLIVKRKII